MTDIVVIRGAGDRDGPDIVDPLISTLAVALRRGRNEMDARATAHVERLLTIPYRSGLELGQIVRVSDELQGATYEGKITALSYAFVGGEAPLAQTQLTLQVPTGFYS